MRQPRQVVCFRAPCPSHLPTTSVGNLPRTGQPRGNFPAPGTVHNPTTVNGKVNTGSIFDKSKSTDHANSTLHKQNFSLGNIPVVGPAVDAAKKTGSDVLKGKIDKLPGDIISGPGKVVKGTVDQVKNTIDPKTPKVGEPKGMTTTDKGFTPANPSSASKPSMVETALKLKQIQDMQKAADAAKAAKASADVAKAQADAKAAQATADAATAQAKTATEQAAQARRRAGAEARQIRGLQDQVDALRQDGAGQVFQQAPALVAEPVVIAPAPTVVSAPAYSTARAYVATPPAPVRQAVVPQVVVPQATPPQANLPQANLAPANAVPQTGTSTTPTAGTDVFVTFQPGVTNEDVAALLEAYKATIVEGPNTEGIFKLRLADPLPPEQIQPLLDSMKGQSTIIATAASG